ncbi:chromate transporter [Paenibacillus sp. IB182496]|uniref:Chromate transporter n=1 Tax=Paenibacillus sabuli TaxID=2772509 RepID=A0A927GR75_9BACL|nr:chromate transporter [Paenibacillus sabuli]MBD2844650.1 chromate transporter [Paenibacillus sabuli]
MEWVELFIRFMLANIFGYGGGPASIPLMYREVVDHAGWMSSTEFSNMLALGNALPGPIATKIAAFVGYDVGGWLGATAALLGTVAPSAIALILLLKLLQRYKQSSSVKGMTLLVQPVIAVMMLMVTWTSLRESVLTIGFWQFAGIAAAALYLMKFRGIHPALLIVAAFVYGGIFLS